MLTEEEGVRCLVCHDRRRIARFDKPSETAIDAVLTCGHRVRCVTKEPS